MTAAAPGTVKVISTAAAPPWAQASAILAAWSEESVRTMATRPDSTIRDRTLILESGIRVHDNFRRLRQRRHRIEKYPRQDPRRVHRRRNIKRNVPIVICPLQNVGNR